jgi:hypothetical protein
MYTILWNFGNYINSKRNRHPLIHIEKEWIFDHRQMWADQRDLVLIRNCLIREPSVNTNSVTVSPPKKIFRNSTLERERDKELKIYLRN